MTLTIINSSRPDDAQQSAQLDNFSNHRTVNKIAADIGFLQDRIALVKSHRHPNPAVLQTYSAMLTRREAALALLLKNKPQGAIE